jgi:NAD(P)-dependent dehydrogenase (short-subunit alcohol dehydrogenase family)
MLLLEDKVVIVTGAGNGIGRECALAAARHGAQVLVNDIGSSLSGDGASADPAHAVVEEICAEGGRAACNYESVADHAAVGRMIEQARDVFGGVHAVIHSAGIVRRSPIDAMEENDWDGVLEVHLKGAFNLVRATLGLFKDQSAGAYVFFSSTAGLIGEVNLASYAAAKMGVAGLSKVVAMETAELGITSNVVAPFAWTRMMSSIPIRDAAQAKAIENYKTSMRADQVAQLCVALCAPAARATGQIFGARGNELMVFSQLRPTRSIACLEGWTPESIVAQALPALKPGYCDLGNSASVFRYRPV